MKDHRVRRLEEKSRTKRFARLYYLHGSTETICRAVRKLEERLQKEHGELVARHVKIVCLHHCEEPAGPIAGPVDLAACEFEEAQEQERIGPLASDDGQVNAGAQDAGGNLPSGRGWQGGLSRFRFATTD